MNSEKKEQRQLSKLELVESCLATMREFLNRSPVDNAKVESHAKKVKHSRPY